MESWRALGTSPHEKNSLIQPETSAARDQSGSLSVATIPANCTPGAVAIRLRAAIVLLGSMFMSATSQSIPPHRRSGTSRARILHC